MKLITFVFVSVLSVAHSENILGIFPLGAKSHFEVFDSLMKKLASRGHSVVVLSPFPKDEPPRNYTSVDARPFKQQILNMMNVTRPSLVNMMNFMKFEVESNGNLLRSQQVQNLLSQNITFGAIIVEVFIEDVILLLAKKFKAPVIGFASSYPPPWTLRNVATQNPSYMPNFFSGFSSRMTFLERVWNTVLAFGNLFYKYVISPKSLEVFERSLGPSEWSVEDADKNISLYLMNSHFTLHGAIPYPQNVIEVGGINLNPSQPLPQDIDRWMNESIGVVYFSFGSMLRGATLPADKVRAFIEVFRSIPQRVLWKWEDDSLEGLPDNVKLMKWLPQRDILAHPKVRVFISHGGLLGTTEAVVSGVPILGIPMYGDQPNNVAALVENKVAIHIDYNNISVSSISYALNQLLTDLSYAKNARILSQRFLDRPQSPLDTAVYWTEYVIRHRGAPHLQSAAVHLTWYQYYLLDVAAFCLAALAATLVAVLYLIKISLRLLLCFEKQKKVKSS